MKRIIPFVLLCFFSNCLYGQQEKEPDEKVSQVIAFDVSEHNFGKIEEKGKKVSYDFTFTNTGNCPLVITRVITSCKCVDSSYNKKPIPPGKEGKITITYNPRKQQGVFHKAIQIYSNASDGMHIITVKGEVKSSDE